MTRLRFAATVACALASAASLLFACSDESGGGGDESPDGATTIRPDGSTGTGDGTGDGDGDVAGEDGGAGSDASDAGPRSTRDANGPGEAGAECIFNYDCAIDLRCSACDAGFCFCEPGARGAGQVGVDTCDDGDDCQSALCVEGPNGTDYYCSDECSGPSDCAGMLPTCKAIASLGTICVRNPPK